MELVAASKMRKAIVRVMKSRAYVGLCRTMLQELMKNNDVHHPLFQAEGQDRVAIFLLTSNRGLCGGDNSKIICKVYSSMEKHSATVDNTSFITNGKKGRDRLHKDGFHIAADFQKPEEIGDEANV